MISIPAECSSWFTWLIGQLEAEHIAAQQLVLFKCTVQSSVCAHLSERSTLDFENIGLSGRYSCRTVTLTSVQWRMRPSEEHEMKFLLPSRSSFCQRTDHTGSECFPVRALLMCVGRTSTVASGTPFALPAAGAAV